MTITGNSPLEQVLELHPQMLAVLRRHGFGHLGESGVRALAAERVSVQEACRRHGLALAGVVVELNRAAAASALPDRLLEAPPRPARRRRKAGPRGPVRPGLRIADVVRRWPATSAVFARCFGTRCFTCPAFTLENVAQACRMHGTDLEEFLAACNAAVATRSHKEDE